MLDKEERELVITLIVAYLKEAKLTYKEFEKIQKIINKLENGN